MTTIDPDTLEQDHSVLQKIVFELDGRTALDCSVLEPGRVRVGDRAELLDSWSPPRPEAASGRASL
jgi:MOSC domain-containing protein YiiM